MKSAQNRPIVPPRPTPYLILFKVRNRALIAFKPFGKQEKGDSEENKELRTQEYFFERSKNFSKMYSESTKTKIPKR